MKQILFLSFLLSLFITDAKAVDGTLESSFRVERPYGFTIGIANPLPSIGGLNAAYTVNDWSRLELGYGEVEVTTGITFDNNGIGLQRRKASTIAAGADFMMPGWNLTPVAGVHIAKVDMSGPGSVEIQGFKESGTHLYSTIGVDWQNKAGFKMGGGYQAVLSGPAVAGFYLNSGWFF